MTSTKRNNAGKFQPGCPPGPGRPRRATEQEYLRTLSEACTPDRWREICVAAVEAARGGDAQARAWLSKFLMGEPSGPAPTLHSLEVTRLLDIDPPLEEAARTIAKKNMVDKMFPMFAADMDDGQHLENARALLLAREAPN